MGTEPKSAEVASIVQDLPHQFPFLLVDRVEELVPGKRIVALAEIVRDAPYFTRHIPGAPVMPGVLQVEALVQAAFILARTASRGTARGGAVQVQGLDHVRFWRKVIPGEVLRLEASVSRKRGSTWIVKGEASVDGERVAEAVILVCLPEQETD